MKPENPVCSRFKINIVDYPSMTESSTAGPSWAQSWKVKEKTDLWGVQKGADSAAGLLFPLPSEQREHQAAGCFWSNCDKWSLRGARSSSPPDQTHTTVLESGWECSTCHLHLYQSRSDWFTLPSASSGHRIYFSVLISVFQVLVRDNLAGLFCSSKYQQYTDRSKRRPLHELEGAAGSRS